MPMFAHSEKKVAMYRIDDRTNEVITANLPVGRGFNNGDPTDACWRKLGWKSMDEMPQNEPPKNEPKNDKAKK